MGTGRRLAEGHDGADALDLLATVRSQPGEPPPIEAAHLRLGDRT
jgi:hypothetical protein